MFLFFLASEALFFFSRQKVLSVEFVRKYIHLARSMKPKLTEGATEYISEVYSEIRSFDTSKTDRERVCGGANL